MHIHSNWKEEQDLTDLIEETFDLCSTNKEELYWLITILRGLMNIPNKRKEDVLDNMKLNTWQYNLAPIIEKYKKTWKHY